MLAKIQKLKTKSQRKTHRISKKSVSLPPISNDGALAQLARAFDWQSRGREFDSHTLHRKYTCGFAGVFLSRNQLFSIQISPGWKECG